MAIRIIADTHAILWYLYGDPLLSPVAANYLESVEQTGEQIAIASITLAEIVYLIEKGRIHPQSFVRIRQLSNKTTLRSSRYHSTDRLPEQCNT